MRNEVRNSYHGFNKLGKNIKVVASTGKEVYGLKGKVLLEEIVLEEENDRESNVDNAYISTSNHISFYYIFYALYGFKLMKINIDTKLKKIFVNDLDYIFSGICI